MDTTDGRPCDEPSGNPVPAGSGMKCELRLQIDILLHENRCQRERLSEALKARDYLTSMYENLVLYARHLEYLINHPPMHEN